MNGEMMGAGSRPGSLWYALLDGALLPDLPASLQRLGLDHACLYRGRLVPEVARAAPYLVALPDPALLPPALLPGARLGNRGILMSATAGMRQLRRHCRRLLTLMSPEQRPLYFRYHDPRVLPVFLRTCDARQLRLFFGPVLEFHAAGTTPETWYRLCLQDGKLLVTEHCDADA